MRAPIDVGLDIDVKDHEPGACWVDTHAERLAIA
jgi:hypothetical protein